MNDQPKFKKGDEVILVRYIDHKFENLPKYYKPFPLFSKLIVLEDDGIEPRYLLGLDTSLNRKTNYKTWFYTEELIPFTET